MRLSAILPCYNEEENVRHAYERITAALKGYDDYEIIITDDGSTDNTLKIVKELAKQDPHVKYISFSRNFGNCAAFRVGYLYASFDWSIQFDADLQSPPEEAYKLIAKAQEGWDVVFAIRQQRQDPLYRVWGKIIQKKLTNKSTILQCSPIKAAQRGLYFLLSNVIESKKSIQMPVVLENEDALTSQKLSLIA